MNAGKIIETSWNEMYQSYGFLKSDSWPSEGSLGWVFGGVFTQHVMASGFASTPTLQIQSCVKFWASTGSQLSSFDANWTVHNRSTQQLKRSCLRLWRLWSSSSQCWRARVWLYTHTITTSWTTCLTTAATRYSNINAFCWKLCKDPTKRPHHDFIINNYPHT